MNEKSVSHRIPLLAIYNGLIRSLSVARLSAIITSIILLQKKKEQQTECACVSVWRVRECVWERDRRTNLRACTSYSRMLGEIIFMAGPARMASRDERDSFYICWPPRRADRLNWAFSYRSRVRLCAPRVCVESRGGGFWLYSIFQYYLVLWTFCRRVKREIKTKKIKKTAETPAPTFFFNRIPSRGSFCLIFSTVEKTRQRDEHSLTQWKSENKMKNREKKSLQI